MKRRLLYLIIPFFCTARLDAYPKTTKQPVTDHYHDIEIVDPFRWLEDSSAEDVSAWDQKQNHFTKQHFSRYKNTDAIFSRLQSFEKQKTKKFLVGEEGRRIIIEYDPEFDQPIYYLQEDQESEIEEILNPNKMAPYTKVDEHSFSPDGKYMTYVLTEGGNEEPIFHIYDLDKREEMRSSLMGKRQANIVWNPNSSGFFYTTHPYRKKEHFQQLFYHSVFTRQNTTILQDSDKMRWVHKLEKNEDYLTIKRAFIDEKGGEYEEEYRLGFNNIYSRPTLILSNAPDKPLEIRKRCKKKNLILTDENAPNRKILIQKRNGEIRELIPESKHFIVDYCGVNYFIAVNYLVNGQSLIRIFDPHGVFEYDVPLPGMGIATIAESASDHTEIMFESIVEPPTCYHYHAVKNTLLYPKSSWNKKTFEDLTLSKVMAKTEDGKKFPVFIGHKKNKQLQPTLLHVYGGFGTLHLPTFRKELIPWLEAGGAVAIPALRGGCEYGKPWHIDGMRENKRNTINDCIAAANCLLENGFTSSSQLVLQGGSNGGLVALSAAVQRPDLFRAVCASHPLTDMLRYHKFSKASVYSGEYGTSEDPELIPYLLDYSPYHQVNPQTAYPSTLIYAGKNDARVHPMHARKMAASLQAATSSKNPILMFMDDAMGHVDSSINSWLHYQSRMLAFLMDQVNMEYNPPEPKKKKK